MIFLFLIVGINPSFAQFKNEEDRKKHANELFENKKFIEAEPHMLHFLSLKNSSDFSFKYGVCALHTYADKTKPLRYFEYAIKDPNVDPRVFFYYAKTKHLNYLFNDALKYYEKFKKSASSKVSSALEVDMHIEMCKSGANLMKNLTDLVVQDKTKTAINKFNYSYDLSEIGGKVIPLGEFQTKQDLKLNYKPIIYFPTSGPNRDVLFFSSYGKDGSNKLDLYKVTRSPNEGWSEPVRLPDNINTPFDESYPFLHPDGKTLFFCSKGHNSMGGYDVFRCYYNSETNSYGTPMNLDYKVNSPDDDILYIVDGANENAYFSSTRASKGGEIDVYKVKVKMFPMQNTVIAGTFFNTYNDKDVLATIKVQDASSDKLMGVYTADKDQNYRIILPRAGLYNFIVETPESEKIHSGQVKINPQKDFKILKQEISLTKENDVEKLIIKNLFDQTVENEAVIMASVIKELANPEINIDEIPDSILNESVEESVIVEEVVEDNSVEIANLLNVTKNHSKVVEQEANELQKQLNATLLIVEEKSNVSKLKAIEADSILKSINNEDDVLVKQEKIKSANKLNHESKKLNQEVKNTVVLSEILQKDLNNKKEELEEVKQMVISVENASNEGNSDEITALSEKFTDNLNEEKELSELQKIRKEANKKKKEADNYLQEAELIRSDQESLEYQLSQKKDALKITTKKKDIQEINEKISFLEDEIAKNSKLAEEQFALYEKAEIEKHELMEVAKVMEGVEQINLDEVSIEQPDVNLESIEESVQEVEEKYIKSNENVIEKEEPIIASLLNENNDDNSELEIIDQNSDENNSNDSNLTVQENNDDLVDDNEQKDLQNNNDESVDKNSETNNENNDDLIDDDYTQNIDSESNNEEENTQDIDENTIEDDDSDDVPFDESVASNYINPDQAETYNEVKDVLEETTSNSEDFSDISEDVITYSNNISQEESGELSAQKNEVSLAKQEINLIEEKINNESNPEKKEKLINEVNEKKNELKEKENELIETYSEINEQEISYNDSLFNEANEDLTEEAKEDEDFLSATVFIEKSKAQLKNAEKVRSEAETTQSEEEKTKLLNQAVQLEMQAIDNQQMANNLIVDVKEKYNNEEKSDEIVSVADVPYDPLDLSEEEEEEFVASLPASIPVIEKKEEAPVERFQGVSFDPNLKPANYEVVPVADDNPTINTSVAQTNANAQILSENQKNIETVETIDNKIEELKSLEKTVLSEKLVAKTEKKIAKLEKKKAKSQLKMADDIESVNQSEIRLLNEKVAASKTYSEAVVNNNYQIKQAENYEKAAVELTENAKAIRAEAEAESDPVLKSNLIEEAIAAENTAISHLNKAEKLYSTALVEDFTEDKYQLAKTVQKEETKQSVKLEKLSEKSYAKAEVYSKRSAEIRDSANALPKKERQKAIVLAEQYEELAKEQTIKSNQFQTQANKIKKMEDAIVEDIALVEEVKQIQNPAVVAGSQEFKDYDKEQKEINTLESNKVSKEQELKKLNSLVEQMENKANELNQKAKTERNPQKQKELKEQANQFVIKSNENKQKSNLINQEIIDLKEEIKVKEMSQAEVISSVDSVTARQIRGLSISGLADEFLDKTEEELASINQENNDPVINVENSTSNEVSPVTLVKNDFVPPVKVVKDLFVINEETNYSEANPIPVNPKMPEGLVYKVQVGAFRRPIPQDLFKGFAPISAEKVRDDITRYRVGYFTTYESADKSKDQVRNLGYRDAFVVAIYNGDKITLAKAREMQDNIQDNSSNINTPPVTNNQNNNEPNNSEIDNEAEKENIVNEVVEETVEEIEEVEVEEVRVANSSTHTSSGLIFSVQIGAFSNPLTEDNVLNVAPLYLEKRRGLFKYTTGEYKTIEEVQQRKNQLLTLGLTDAFIVAYNSGTQISISNALSLNPSAPPKPSNPIIYFIDLGTYKDSVPTTLSNGLMNLSSIGVKSRIRLTGKQYFSQKFTSLNDANKAVEVVKQQGIENYKVVKSSQKDFTFNYEYKVDLGVYYEGLPEKLKVVFDEIGNIEEYPEGRGVKYMTKSKSSYAEVQNDLQLCKDKGIAVSKIVAYKDGVSINIDSILNESD